MKSGIRILALDDSPFDKRDRRALVIGVVWRSGFAEGIISFDVRVDGNDATEQILKHVKASKFFPQIKMVVLHGTTLAGLNFVDVPELHKKLKLPVVCVIRKEPHRIRLLKAIKAGTPDFYSEKAALLRAESRQMGKSKYKNSYFQFLGIELGGLKKFSPELLQALRLAHLIGSGVAKGESSGRL